MTKILTTDEIIWALKNERHPMANDFAQRIEMLCQEAADTLAAHLNIVSGTATCEEPAFAGTACPFYRRTEADFADHPETCPDALEDFDCGEPLDAWEDKPELKAASFTCAGTPIPEDSESDGEHAFNANGVCLVCEVKDTRG